MSQPGGKRYVYDRREGDLFVLSAPDGAERAVAELPPGARAGDTVEDTGCGFVICREESDARRDRVQEKFDRLFHKR